MYFLKKTTYLIHLPIKFFLQTQRLELSLVPSEKSNSVEHMIHPNIPFLTIRETKKRGTKFNTDLTTPKAWKVTLIIQNGVVYYLDHDLKTKKRVDVLHNGNQIKLGMCKFFLKYSMKKY